MPSYYIWKNSYDFAYVDIRKEGGKLWPNDYLRFNGKYPNPSFYTDKELKELKQHGYTYQEYHE